MVGKSQLGGDKQLTFLVEIRCRVLERAEFGCFSGFLHGSQVAMLFGKGPDESFFPVTEDGQGVRPLANEKILPLFLHGIHCRADVLVVRCNLLLELGLLVGTVRKRDTHRRIVLLSALTVLVLGSDIRSDIVQERLPVIATVQERLLFEFHAVLNGSRFDFSEGQSRKTGQSL